MTDYRIPPVGYCVTCLVAFEQEKPAMALWKGTSLCAKHLNDAVNPEVSDELDRRGYEGGKPEGKAAWEPPTDPESDPVHRPGR